VVRSTGSGGRRVRQLRVQVSASGTVCGRWRVQDAALQDAAEEVEALVTAVEPVAELVEAGLQVRGAGAREDVESPAREVGG